MKVVIDIDDNLYTRLFDNGENYVADMRRACVAIRKGVILPKGHGDLIDRRELKKEVYTTTEWNGDVHRIIYEASVDDAPTIIEADKTEDLDNLDSMLEHLWNATVEDHRKYSEDMKSEDKNEGI